MILVVHDWLALAKNCIRRTRARQIKENKPVISKVLWSLGPSWRKAGLDFRKRLKWASSGSPRTASYRQ
jgi:hypothetical protein